MRVDNMKRIALVFPMAMLKEGENEYPVELVD